MASKQATIAGVSWLQTQTRSNSYFSWQCAGLSCDFFICMMLSEILDLSGQAFSGPGEADVSLGRLLPKLFGGSLCGGSCRVGSHGIACHAATATCHAATATASALRATDPAMPTAVVTRKGLNFRSAQASSHESL